MPKRILIVDDDPSILEMTSLVLGKRGYEVATAPHGILALQEIQKKLPDLILTDVLMPEMDGYSFYKELKKNTATADIPVLIITARGKMEDTFKVMGADGFIAKPILPEELYAEIEHVFRIVETREEMTQGSGEQINRKVLIVTPEESILQSMKFEAERAGYIVTVSASGADAIAKVVKFLPDMIFVDVLMDDIAVGEIIHIFRRLPQCDDKPIIGFCYYKTQDLGDSRVRKKIVGINEASKQALLCGASTYMGRYNPQLFVKVLKDNLKDKKTAE